MAARAGGSAPVLVWFRNDLRIADQAALAAAASRGRAVVPVFVLEDEDAGRWAWGGASRWWLHGSLAALGQDLAALGAPLVLRRGRAEEVLPALMAEVGATAIHAGRAFEPWARKVEQALAAALPADALVLHRTRTFFDLDVIRTKGGGPFGIYAPFARALLARAAPAEPKPAPTRLAGVPGIRSDALDDWELLPTRPDWAAGFRATWQPGEAAARKRLDAFADDRLRRYHEGRNQPAINGSSTLSAALHWGELSGETVWHAAAGQDGEGAGKFRAEVLWREFSAYTLWHNPSLPEEPLRPPMARLKHREAPDELRAWQRGRTGVPIVDAGMRHLWNVGWMPNRLRMITGSFLVKHLLQRWQDGEAWFWDTLVDADLANNAINWQWVAGTGVDTQPFFRVFNPVSQAMKFDADGAYTRRWVPELARVPLRWLHEPWAAPDAELGGVVLGRDYPRPIVDLREGRTRALAALRAVRIDG